MSVGIPAHVLSHLSPVYEHTVVKNANTAIDNALLQLMVRGAFHGAFQ